MHLRWKFSRKLGDPDDAEYALGVVEETGTVYLNPDTMAAYSLARGDH
jgi:predicted phosphoribosyltransferase